jgi:hypothetical protein
MMSEEKVKVKTSKRRHQTDTAIAKQVRIAKQYGVDTQYISHPHKFAKRHVFDCGNPKCGVCSNPRHNKLSKDKLTIQEKRLFQDADSINDRHSNGILTNENFTK